MRHAWAKHRSDVGYSIIDLLVVLGLASVLMAMAVPAYRDLTRSMKLGTSMREVERELQAARLKAVSSNRPVRVRFNCPAAGQFRLVEVVGSKSVPVAADNAAAAVRCSQTTYPFPAPDRNPLTLPNHDGPVRRLGTNVTFGTVSTLEFWPDGSVHQASVAGTSPWPVVSPAGTTIPLNLALNNVVTTRSISVNGLGKIQIQR